MLVNTEGRFADDLGEAIARLVLKLPRAAVVDFPIDPAEAAAVAGTYEVTGVATLVVEAEGAQLFIHATGDPNRTRLQRQGDASYMVTGATAKLVFVRIGDRVTKLQYIVAGVALDGIRE